MARPKVLGDTKRLMVSLPLDLAKAVEDYRFDHRLKTEADAIRRLIEAGLKAADPIPIRGSKPDDDTGSSELGKRQRSPTPKAPKAKPERSAQPPSSPKPASKEAQLRALRESRP
jgi:hypothetical protein